MDATRSLTALRAALRIAVLTIGVSLWWIVGSPHAGHVRAAHPAAHRERADGGDRVHADRRPPRHRQLVLLRQGPARVLDRPGRGLRQQRRGADRELRDPGRRAGGGRARPLAAPGVLRAARVVGTVVSVGAWPYDDPSPYGASVQVVRRRHRRRASRCATRRVPSRCSCSGSPACSPPGSPRSRPASAVRAPPSSSACSRSPRSCPVWSTATSRSTSTAPRTCPATGRTRSPRMQREGDVDPRAGDPRQRLLRVPVGRHHRTDHARADRPALRGARDAAVGSAASVNLLLALDHRIQDGTFEPDALAAYARLANIGTVALRSDLEYERFDTPRPRLLWDQLTDPLPAGLDDPMPLRAASPRTGRRPPVPAIDALELGDPRRRRQPTAGRVVRREGRDPDRAHRADRAAGRARRRRRGHRRRGRRRSARRAFAGPRVRFA